jgi:hypothetical protein
MSDNIFNEILVYFFYRNPPQLPQDFEFCNRPNISFCIDKTGNPSPPPPPPPLPNNGNDVFDTGGVGWGVFVLNVIFIIFFIYNRHIKLISNQNTYPPTRNNTTHQNVSTIRNNTNIHLSNMQQNQTV